MPSAFSIDFNLISSFMLALILAISLHESAHAITAVYLGDETPRLEGRFTLNPLKHLSLFGTLLPFIAVLTRAPFLFGWGKPVRINRANLRGRWSYVLVALSGPAMNLGLCLITGIVVSLLIKFSDMSNETWIMQSLGAFIQLNAILTIFNLLPLPPLDGSVLLIEILPDSAREFYQDYIAPYSFYIVLALILSGRFSWIYAAAEALISISTSIIAPLT